MIKAISVILVAIPLGATAFHLVVGGELGTQDQLASLFQRAQDAEKKGNWAGAIAIYDTAIAMSGASEPDRLKYRLFRTHAMIFDETRVDRRPSALAEMRVIFAEAKAKLGPDHPLTSRIMACIATEYFHNAIDLRKNVAPLEAWFREAEDARQYFRYLFETADRRGDLAIADYGRNLACVEKLIHLDEPSLKALAFPSNSVMSPDCEELTSHHREDEDRKQRRPEPTKRREDDGQRLDRRKDGEGQSGSGNPSRSGS